MLNLPGKNPTSTLTEPFRCLEILGILPVMESQSWVEEDQGDSSSESGTSESQAKQGLQFPEQAWVNHGPLTHGKSLGAQCIL